MVMFRRGGAMDVYCVGVEVLRGGGFWGSDMCDGRLMIVGRDCWLGW